ncbi:2-polyprenyl-6-methoxyphenol hydroxylase [Asanoa hainanensis]|uniref:2-polyprenyl-6-methoxyphenol hydroxylase n=1 Tax=Asanoa hainanensis TaxID=560556 RepID=A0A239H4Y0_9ACTN|nr:2-polyprenyl-6-methoxyphenol hydroxylase [Asanoa hainanensis]
MKAYDIVVVGASVAGTAFAMALRDEGLRILVVDPQVDFDESRMTWGHDIEPNGLLALDWLGLLDDIKRLGVRHERWIAEREGGGRLSEWRYDELRHTHAYAVCVRAHLLRRRLRERLSGVDVVIPGAFQGYRRVEGGVHVDIEVEGERRTASAKLLVGADGPRSRVRAQAGIGARVRRYSHSWVDTIMSRDDDTLTEGHIYFGRGSYLGVVPTRPGELVAFELTAGPHRVGGIERFREDYVRRAPILAGSVDSVESWDQVTVAPGFRMRAERWVADHVALLGDAALTVNPITSQGVSLALEDALTLAVVTGQAFRRGDFTARALRPYELWRRPQAERIQELGDLSLWGFTRRSRVLSALKERTLRHLAADRDFRTYVMASYCGLHWLTPKPLTILNAVRRPHPV